MEDPLPPRNYCAGVLVVSTVAGRVKILLGRGMDGWSDFGGKNSKEYVGPARRRSPILAMRED